MLFFVVVIYAFLAVGGLTLFKVGAQQVLDISITSKALSMNVSWLSVTGLILYVCSFLIYMGLISKNQLSYLTPISTGLVYLLTFAVALLVFREPITSFKLMGSILVLCGILLMNLK